MELAKLSLAELRRLQSKVETEIRRRSDTARRDLLKRMQKMAADEGLSLSEVLESTAAEGGEKKRAAPKRKAAVPGRSKKAAKAPSPFKFRHPENPSIGWSGRGRKPQWVIDWLAQNKPIDQLAVNAAE